LLTQRSADTKAMTPEARAEAKKNMALMYTTLCAGALKDSAECMSPTVKAIFLGSAGGGKGIGGAKGGGKGGGKGSGIGGAQTTPTGA